MSRGSVFAFVTATYDNYVARDLNDFNAVYVGRAPNQASTRLRVLKVDDVYPPVCKNLLAWHDVKLKEKDKYIWFMRCDQDTVIHSAQLQRYMAHLTNTYRTPLPVYTGRMGRGRSFERKTNNISFTFAMGGTCEVLNDVALRMLNTQNVVAACNRPPYKLVCPPHCHSDVELGRLLHTAGVAYTRPPNMYDTFHHTYPKVRINQTMQTPDSTDTPGLFARYTTSGYLTTPFTVYHPVKNIKLYNTIMQILRGATPPHAHKYVDCSHVPEFLQWYTSKRCSTRGDITFLRNYPPRCLRDEASISQKVCACPALKADPLSTAFGVVSSLVDATAYTKGLVALLNLKREPEIIGYHSDLHMHGMPLEKLMPGEIAVRMAFLKALHRAMLQTSHLLWLEDDLLIRRDFTARWSALQRTHRNCTGFLQHPGGILLLGASEWTQRAWADERTKMGDGCYGSLPRTTGAFALLASRSVLPLIEKFLISSNRPLDHMYTYIQREGFPVRVLYPNLIIADTRHASQTNPSRRIVHNRHKLLRWDNFSSYVSPADHPQLQNASSKRQL